MSLRSTYTVFAPIYDFVVARATASLRARSLAALPRGAGARILVCGIGTGLDVPSLPPGNTHVGIDLTRAMLDRVPRRHDLVLAQGDAMRLPFADGTFDHAVLHLIVAVVPHSEQCLAEAARVTKRGGTLLVVDKFLRRGERAWLRRALNPISRRLATRLDVVFEDVLAQVPSLEVVEDLPALAGGWFRRIRLRKR